MLIFWVEPWFHWAIVIVTMIILTLTYIITEKLFKPIWYEQHKNSDKLSMEPINLEDSWRVDALHSGLGNPKTELNLPYENVSFPVGPLHLPGNKDLRGWLIPAPPKSTTTTTTTTNLSSSSNVDNEDRRLCIVVCHGGARDRRQHLRHVPSLRAYGAAVLLFDKQEHGLSDGAQRGIGWFTYEGSDVYAACRYAKLERGYERVIAMGSSFGGVGVITAAGYFDKAVRMTTKGGDDEDDNNDEYDGHVIDGVIAENPPCSRERYVRELLRKYISIPLMPWLISDILSMFACALIIIRRGWGTFHTPGPIDVIKNVSPRPLLITHGDADQIVPIEHAFDLYREAQEPKECLWVKNCDHTMVFNVDPVGWGIKTGKIIRQVLERKGGRPKLQQRNAL